MRGVHLLSCPSHGTGGWVFLKEKQSIVTQRRGGTYCRGRNKRPNRYTFTLVTSSHSTPQYDFSRDRRHAGCSSWVLGVSDDAEGYWLVSEDIYFL